MPDQAKDQFRAAYGAIRLTLASISNTASHGYVASNLSSIATATAKPILAAGTAAAVSRKWADRYNGIQTWPAETRHLAVNRALRCAQVRRWGFSTTPSREAV